MILKLNGQIARDAAKRYIQDAPEGWVMRLTEPTRSLEANAQMWVLLECFAEQLEWPVNGVMTKLSKEEWKTLTTAAFEREQVRVSPGLDGGMVMLGARTRQYGKAKMSEFIDFLQAVGTERGVRFDAPY